MEGDVAADHGTELPSAPLTAGRCQ
jgi:hypothetical protein